MVDASGGAREDVKSFCSKYGVVGGGTGVAWRVGGWHGDGIMTVCFDCLGRHLVWGAKEGM